MWLTDSLITDDLENKQGKAGVSSFIMNRTVYGQIRGHSRERRCDRKQKNGSPLSRCNMVRDQEQRR